MPRYNTAQPFSKFTPIDSAGNPFGFIEIGEGTSSCFTVLLLTVGNDTYYYWPSTSGVLRYGTTMPTVDTQNSAGNPVYWG